MEFKEFKESKRELTGKEMSATGYLFGAECSSLLQYANCIYIEKHKDGGYSLFESNKEHSGKLEWLERILYSFYENHFN